MREIVGDIWLQQGSIGITTNGVVNSSGQLVMGGGQALQAKQMYPDLPEFFGRLVADRGNQVYWNHKYGVFSFPTKEHYRDTSTVEIIDRSSKQLYDILTSEYGYEYGWDLPNCLLVPPGCGLGGLDYQTQVRPILLKYFAELPLTIVDNEGKIIAS